MTPRARRTVRVIKICLTEKQRSIIAAMTSRTSLASYTLSFCLLAAACRGAKNSELPTTHRLSANAMVCEVDPDHVLRAVPRGIFGTNLEWFNNADGLSAADGSVNPEWSRLAREQGIDNIRFPGGTLSDFYHWRDGIGPVSKRPVRDHPTDSGKSPNVMGTPEFLRFCQSAAARPLITVNAGTADAAEAAEWVAYCNAPNNVERAADGLSAPAAVQLWEIGNELYLPGNPTDKKIITVPPAVYADRFLEFASAMRKVDPSIKLMAIGTANPTQVALPYPDWSDVLLQKAAAQMDYIAVHNAYFPMIFGQTGLTTKEVYQSLMAAPEAVERSLQTLDTLISKYEKGRHIEIAVTEWGALFSFDPDWIDHVKTMGTAVYFARLMQVFLGQPRVTVANYFKFTDRSFMGWVGYDRKPKIPYYVIQLFSQHFGTHLISATVESPKYSVKSVAITPASTAPEITVVASIDDTGRKLFVNLVNRSWDTVHQVTLKTGHFTPSDKATAWILSAPGLTDHNGPDLPPEFPSGLYNEPTQSRNSAGPTTLEHKTIDIKSPILVPPYSILTLELDAQS